LDKHHIDFVAHDAIVCTTGGKKDEYGYVKSVGKFIAEWFLPLKSLTEWFISAATIIKVEGL
jgi:hypothetical protein